MGVLEDPPCLRCAPNLRIAAVSPLSSLAIGTTMLHRNPILAAAQRLLRRAQHKTESRAHFHQWAGHNDHRTGALTGP
jgi:hypothetical protein